LVFHLLKKLNLSTATALSGIKKQQHTHTHTHTQKTISKRNIEEKLESVCVKESMWGTVIDSG